MMLATLAQSRIFSRLTEGFRLGRDQVQFDGMVSSMAVTGWVLHTFTLRRFDSRDTECFISIERQVGR